MEEPGPNPSADGGIVCGSLRSLRPALPQSVAGHKEEHTVTLGDTEAMLRRREAIAHLP